MCCTTEAEYLAVPDSSYLVCTLLDCLVLMGLFYAVQLQKIRGALSPQEQKASMLALRSDSLLTQYRNLAIV